MIAIIDGCGANIASLQFALERLNKQSVLTNDVAVINSADRVILPGVGTANYTMAQLRRHRLFDVIRSLTQPVLGICLGMQVLYQASAEGDVGCLGILEGGIQHFPTDKGLIIPHMGWNQLTSNGRQSPLFEDITDGSYVYFVHSYHATVSPQTIATTSYGETFACAVNERNFYGVQFHPERSGIVGEKILRNFVEM